MAQPMLSLEAATARMLALARLTDGETVAIAEAVGRALVEPLVVAPIDVPGFANSSMDGYAIRAADAPGRLRLVGEILAGASELPSIEPGTAARIMTGAPLPADADAVVPIEDAAESDGDVSIPAPVAAGAFVRAAGHDTRAGAEICVSGALTPAKIAVLASLGIGAVEVRGRPAVAILSTGDELVGPGEVLRPGQIHDANGPSLAAAVAEAGGVPHVLARLADDEQAIEKALVDAAASADLVVASGGVSVGRRDFVRAVLERRGALDFWRIAVQPGKPLAIGALDGTPVVGLPGNPVSALVTFELFARPLLRAMAGLTGDGRLHVRLTPTEPMSKDRARRAFLRVVAFSDGDVLRARPAGGQASSQLRPMAEANALLAVPEDVDSAVPGDVYDAILLEPLGR